MSPLGQFMVPDHHLPPGFDQLQAVAGSHELGCLVNNTFRSGYFPNIVKPCGHPKFLHLMVGKTNPGEPTCLHRVDFIRNGHGEVGHPSDVSAGIGRLFVDSLCDGLYKGIQKIFETFNQPVLRNGHGGLRGK